MNDEKAQATETTNGAASALCAGLGAMLRNGMRFVEAKSHGKTPPNYACEGCAFLGHPALCAKAIDGAAKAAFGGDCDERDVIYVRCVAELDEICNKGMEQLSRNAEKLAAALETPNVEPSGGAPLHGAPPLERRVRRCLVTGDVCECSLGGIGASRRNHFWNETD